jgi:hypothetical protein
VHGFAQGLAWHVVDDQIKILQASNVHLLLRGPVAAEKCSS